ncbi:MAG: hypothetical protein KAJ14_04335 [Candidatus Omnitrophica bacterium]|nr:hypothetical protein [Candidatus Omnitrophota bacterium]
MEEKGNIFKGEEERSEARLEADQYCSVEFSISKEKPDYLFEIRDVSSFGLCIIVKDGSSILNHIKVGDIMDMKYYYPKKAKRPELIKTEIKHITKDNLGRYKGNYLVGLSLLNKGSLNP